MKYLDKNGCLFIGSALQTDSISRFFQQSPLSRTKRPRVYHHLPRFLHAIELRRPLPAHPQSRHRLNEIPGLDVVAASTPLYRPPQLHNCFRKGLATPVYFFSFRRAQSSNEADCANRAGFDGLNEKRGDGIAGDRGGNRAIGPSQVLREVAVGYAFLQFAVREPFPIWSSQASLVYEKVDAAHTLRLSTLMTECGVIFCDGIDGLCGGTFGS